MEGASSDEPFNAIGRGGSKGTAASASTPTASPSSTISYATSPAGRARADHRAGRRHRPPPGITARPAVFLLCRPARQPGGS